MEKCKINFKTLHSSLEQYVEISSSLVEFNLQGITPFTIPHEMFEEIMEGYLFAKNMIKNDNK